MWGKLPSPKYLVNTILSDNAAIRAAFQTGEIDVSQAFMPNVHLLWEDDGLPVSTYFQDAPYHLSANMPTIWFNLRTNANPVLKEVALRKAIAIATDYDAINANAMTYQSPTFAEVPRSLMNPTPGEQAMYDHNAVKDLQWVGNDVAGAIALLDEAGIVDTNGDGWREFNGEKISLVASCPSGWSDWEASLEIVAAAGKNIGIEITTNFVQESEFYDNVVYDPNSTAFDIFMMWTNSISPTEPWGRIRNMLSSEFIGMANNWSGNWNHYSNPRIDEIIKAIPLETDMNKQKALYTEAVQIYLTDVPSFSAMYRPDKFHTVCESVWTGFTEQGDGRNVPPFNCLSGYAIADLYNLTLVG
jgi:peptide/nickel transport system substrate-binding protein